MRKFVVNVNGNSYEVEVEEVGGAVTSAPVAAPAPKSASPAPKPAAAPKAAAPSAPPPSGAKNVTAPMPGNILSVKVNVGDTVNSGDVLCVLEAMKMENEIMAPGAGKVVAVSVAPGNSVNTGDVLVSIG